jgi:hypothetical protein
VALLTHVGQIASTLLDYLACVAEPALTRLERWGFGQVPSDGVHFVPVLSEVFDGLWFFSAALVGPIANLNAVPFSESNADASCGIAIANAPIPISRSTWRPMMFMM